MFICSAAVCGHFRIDGKCGHSQKPGRFKRDADDTAGYFTADTGDDGIDFRGEIIETPEQMRFEIEASHHEVAEGQPALKPPGLGAATLTVEPPRAAQAPRVRRRTGCSTVCKHSSTR